MQLHFARWRVHVAAFVVGSALAGAAQAQAPNPARVPMPPREPGPATIDADQIEGVGGQEVTARGNAELRQDDTVIFGDYLRFNQEFGRIEADGGVRMQQGNDRFSGSRLRYDGRNHTGVLEESAFSMRGDQPARGTAETMEFLGPGHIKVKNGTYTSCEPGRNDWHFDMSELELDYDTQTGTMRNGTLSFMDTRIGPIPWISFPLENRRKSGFLAPTYAQSSSSGLTVSVPFYWNIAPEQDATITPRYMYRRGAMLLNEYRYMDRSYRGETRFELLPNDNLAGRSRSGISIVHEQTFTPQLTGSLNLNKVSDDRYFVDLSSRVSQTSTVNLPREGFLQYGGSLGGAGYYVATRVQRFQTLQLDPLNPSTPPYERLPQVTFGIGKNDIAGIGDFSLPAEYTRFSHPTLVEGQRVAMNPTFTAPIVAPGYFIKPKVGLHYAGYNLQNAPAGTPDNQSVTIPWFSVDSGLVFERNVKLAGESFAQTLEPRLFYVNIPFRDQSRIPVFDTGLADFNYASIFTENRFAGNDRFGDANQLTAALTTRLLGTTGLERLRATIAQRFYFENERVGLTPTSVLRTYQSSDLLASVGGKVSKEWSFDTNYEYNPRLVRTERFNAAMRYAPELAKVINLGYRFTRDTLKQIDVSGQWPLRPGWYGVGRYNYSLSDGRLLEGIGGLEYNAGCWILRVVGHRLQTSTQLYNTSVFVQLELGDLLRVGTDPGDVLKRSVPTYTSTHLRPDQPVPSNLQPKLPFDLVY